MSTTAEVLSELDRLIGLAKPEERPALVVQLSARLAALGAGFVVPSDQEGKAGQREPATWIRVEVAAEIAKVPVKRLYEWAVGKKWASRPTRRCLRINEAGFRAWLASKGR